MASQSSHLPWLTLRAREGESFHASDWRKLPTLTPRGATDLKINTAGLKINPKRLHDRQL